MEVKPGDQPHAEEHQFPRDWRLLQVQDVIAAYFCGPSPTCEERNIRDNEEWGVLKTTAATRGKGWDWTKHKTLPRVFWNKPQIELKKGDVIVTKAGPRHRVGVTAWIDYVPPRIIPSGKMIALRPNPNKVVPLMLAAAVAARDAQTYLDQRTTGMAESQVNFENVALLETPIHLPPIEEQRAIQTALSDVDGLLGGLDRLIAKKRDLKQAAMQQLLTGQTRLPGFNGKWELKRLGDVLKVRHGKSQHGITAPDGEFPILASGGEIGRTNTPLYDKPSVLIGRKGTIDLPQYAATPFWTVDTLFFTEISAAADAKFVFYKFVMIPWRSYNEASGVPSLNAKTIEKIEILFPSSSAEQTAIAEVLTEMDTELAALEQRRKKTRALKWAMMQELLTGKTRLVSTGEAHA